MMRESVKIALGGAVFYMRPTFQAYGDIEARCGASLRHVYTNVVMGTATLQDLASIVLVGLQQVEGQTTDARTGADFQVETIAERIFDNGAWSAETIGPVSDFLAALGWTPEQRKKIEAEAVENEGPTRSA